MDLPRPVGWAISSSVYLLLIHDIEEMAPCFGEGPP